MHSQLITKDALLQCSEGVLFGENTPRLPSPPFLAVDEVIEISDEGGKYGHGFAVARLQLDSMDWIFKSHFSTDPVFPGTLMVEGLLQLSGFFGAYVGVKGKGRAARMDDIKFLSEVVPEDEEITYRIDIRKRNARANLLITEGSVSTHGRECAAVGNMWMIIKPDDAPKPTVH